MRQFFARKLMRKFSQHYGYDTTYLMTMLDHAPRAFFKFNKIQPVAQHREFVDAEAYYTVKLMAAMSEDCGPCTQLVVDMAREAGVEEGQIRSVLTGETDAMSAATELGYRFGQVASHRKGLSLEAEAETREAVRARWGEAGLVELSLCFAIGRVFPSVKTAMGFGKECRRVTVDSSEVRVASHAT